MLKVFLGGTCNGSVWRDELIPMLKVDFFNPVVEDWTPKCQAEERKQRKTCDYVLYVVTPKMKGVYSIAEVVDDSNKRPRKTILCILPEYDNLTFDASQLKSLMQVSKLVKDNGGQVFSKLRGIANYLNSKQTDIDIPQII